MNQDTLQGRWKQLKGKAKERWGKLTDDDLERVEGRSEHLAGVVQEKYGKTKDEARKDVDEFKRSCDC